MNTQRKIIEKIQAVGCQGRSTGRVIRDADKRKPSKAQVRLISQPQGK